MYCEDNYSSIQTKPSYYLVYFPSDVLFEETRINSFQINGLNIVCDENKWHTNEANQKRLGMRIAGN